MMTVRRLASLFTAAVFVVLAALFLLIFSSVEFTPAQPPDFYSDQWAAECNSSTARQSVKKRYRHDLTYSCESFTGAQTLWRVYVSSGEGEAVTLHYQMTVEEGLADLALVRPDGTVTRLSGGTSPYTFTPQEGETRLRLIGEKGRLRLELTIREMSGQWMT